MFMWNTSIIRKNSIRNLVLGVDPSITRKRKIPGWCPLTFCSYLFWISPQMNNCLITLTNKPSSPFWTCGVVGNRILNLSISEGCQMIAWVCKPPVHDAFVWVMKHCDSPCPAKSVNSTWPLGTSENYLHVSICNLIRNLFAVHGNFKWITSRAAGVVTSSLVCFFLGDAIVIFLPMPLQWHRTTKPRRKPRAHMPFLTEKRQCL